MNKIKLFDCTLRDGGHVNDWKFGEQNIKTIINNLVSSGIEIIECGYLSSKGNVDRDFSRYSTIEDLKGYLPPINKNQKYVLMINYGEYDLSLLKNADIDFPALRVAFHKKDKDGAINYIKGLIKLGYEIFVQPMGVVDYSDCEFVDLINEFNCMKISCFYIVDSFGVLDLANFKRYLFLADKSLSVNIELGYHAHDNLQQAFGNARFMAEQPLHHDLIIDGSVFGMGRGAGNLNIELFAKFLNENFNRSYEIEPLLETFDLCLKPVFLNHYWGYSLPCYLSSVHNCHPKYSNYYFDKNTLSVEDVHALLSSLADDERISFNEKTAEEHYIKYIQGKK